MKPLLDFLRDTAAAVRALEAEAEEALHKAKDEARYRAGMRRKAELLAALAHRAAPLLAAVPEARRPAIAARLEAMSQSARRSLELDSVFYMSALLYPEDHRPGEPNDLEKWIADLTRHG